MGAATAWGSVARHGERFDLAFERLYATTPEDVWEAVTTGHRLSRWLAPCRGELRLGGRWEALGPEGVADPDYGPGWQTYLERLDDLLGPAPTPSSTPPGAPAPPGRSASPSCARPGSRCSAAPG